MASNALELVVKIKALDQLKAPLEKIGEKVKAASQHLNKLKQAQEKIGKHREMSQQLTDTASKMDAARNKMRELQNQMWRSKTRPTK